MALILGRSRELALESAEANDVANAQIFEVSPFELAQFADLVASYGRDIRVRSGPSPRYNCHGMTFAARRTGIFDTITVQQILVEDRYIEIPSQDVLPGDVLLYLASDGDIEHSAVIVSPPSAESLGIPLVYSKWGKFSEVIHRANNCPYSFANSGYYRVVLP